MQALILEATENSPKVIFDPSKSLFEISGESRPEDVRKFYEPILGWIDQFEQNLLSETNSYTNGQTKDLKFSFIFEYFNSSSAKYIMDIMAKLNEIQINNPKLKFEILWHYEKMDEDMQEAGEEFQNITKIPFRFIVI